VCDTCCSSGVGIAVVLDAAALGAAETLKASGAIIVRLVFALDRMEGARENVEAAGFEFNALLNKQDLGI